MNVYYAQFGLNIISRIIKKFRGKQTLDRVKFKRCNASLVMETM